MKRSIILVFVALTVLLVFNNISFAGEIKVNINDKPVENEYLEDRYFNKKEHIEQMEGFKVNGGPMIGIMNLDLSQLNNSLPEGFSKLDENLLLKGGGGIIGSKKGSRIGGYGFKGAVNAIGSDGQKAYLELAYAGFLYEKALYTTDRVDISMGSLFGGGLAKLDLVYGDFIDMDQANSNSFEKSFMVIEPRLNIHYQLAVLIGMDLSIGYFMNLDFTNNDWNYYDNSVNLSLDSLCSPVTSLKFSIGF